VYFIKRTGGFDFDLAGSKLSLEQIVKWCLKGSLFAEESEVFAADPTI